MELFQKHLMLYFTGFSRIASDIAVEQIRNIPKKETELHAMQAMVEEGINILREGRDFREFGALLQESWKLKRTLSSRISNNHIDAIYDKAIAAGALGGKLCGAGGGGFLLLFAEPDKQPAVRHALKDYLHVPFLFDWFGSTIIFHRPSPQGMDADSALAAGDTLSA